MAWGVMLMTIVIRMDATLRCLEFFSGCNGQISDSQYVSVITFMCQLN